MIKEVIKDLPKAQMTFVVIWAQLGPKIEENMSVNKKKRMQLPRQLYLLKKAHLVSRDGDSRVK